MLVVGNAGFEGRGDCDARQWYYLDFNIFYFLLFRALYGSFVAISIIVSLLAIAALVIFAFYAECDLICSNRIMQNDQVK